MINAGVRALQVRGDSRWPGDLAQRVNCLDEFLEHVQGHVQDSLEIMCNAE